MTTKTYIRMCEKGEEIQKLFEPNKYDLHLWSGDLFHDWDRERFNYDGYVDFGGVKQHQFKGKIDGYLWHCIWLPTQKQLQKMIYAYCDYERINRISEFVGMDAFEYGWDAWCEFINDASMEEIWLVFIMYKKYNKVWNGNDWQVKEDKK